MQTRRIQFWMLAITAILLLVAPVRRGDLAGYDDAVYAHIAKSIVRSGDWVNIQSNGYPALEQPPGFVWMQAALFHVFGFSDFLAKLPSALCGVGTVLLVYWLAKRTLQSEHSALLAMFIMLATPYFIKYTAHGMTDVPFTFLFLAAVCAWFKAEEDPKWYLTVAMIAGYALLTRGLVGLTLLATLTIDGLGRKRKGSAFVAIAVSLLPVAAWYWSQHRQYGSFFWEVQSQFLNAKINGDDNGAGSYRRYTGLFEYAWMFAQSYWPWLPFLFVGFWMALRQRDSRLTLLLIWCAVMYGACAIGGSRVLRYLLPAYPAFSILAARGIETLIPQRYVDVGMRWAIPAFVLVGMIAALFFPGNEHAREIKPIATAVRSATAEKERFAFYDEGQPRFDETGQLQWYGDRVMWILTDANAFDHALAEPVAKVWVVDSITYDKHFAARSEATLIARSGHLVCVRLT